MKYYEISNYTTKKWIINSDSPDEILNYTTLVGSKWDCLTGSRWVFTSRTIVNIVENCGPAPRFLNIPYVVTAPLVDCLPLSQLLFLISCDP